MQGRTSPVRIGQELVTPELHCSSVRVSAVAFDDAIRVATKASKPEQIARHDLISLLVQLRLAEPDHCRASTGERLSHITRHRHFS